MKKAILILFVSGFLSCKDDKKAKPDIVNEYTYSAKRNDGVWTGTTEIQVPEGKDSLTILAISNRPNDEVLVMKIKFIGPGTYPLKTGQALYYSTIGSDVIVSRYALADGETGHLVITGYDADQKVLNGTFNITLVKKYSNPENNTDTLKFKDGIFKGKINNQ